jgi:hypothetical protein
VEAAARASHPFLVRSVLVLYDQGMKATGERTSYGPNDRKIRLAQAAAHSPNPPSVRMCYIRNHCARPPFSI